MKLQLSVSMIASFAIAISMALLLLYLAHLIVGNQQFYASQKFLHNSICSYLNMCGGA
ncbi:MAG: hypothetical protein ACP5FR_02930 [Candidatus Micrarchaeia archaeon]